MTAQRTQAEAIASMALQGAIDNGRSSELGWFSNPVEQASRTLIDALIQTSCQHNRDFADLLAAYRLGNLHETAVNGNPNKMREAAQTIRDEAERVADQLEQAADYAEDRQ